MQAILLLVWSWVNPRLAVGTGSKNSLLTVDRKTETMKYNPEFYAMKHVSATVLPGAQRIAVSGGPFKRRGRICRVLVYANATEKTVSVTLPVGEPSYNWMYPDESMNTVVIRRSQELF
jgi:glucosylceramidase